MNFIYSILLFLSLAVACFFTSIVVPVVDCQLFFQAWSGGFSALAFIFFIVCFFYQMDARLTVKSCFIEVVSSKEYIAVFESQLDRYKTELRDILTISYPEYEKSAFADLKPEDLNNLSAIMVMYPELKYNQILTNYVSGITEVLRSIVDKKMEIAKIKKRLMDIDLDTWRIGKPIKVDFEI
jgi:hypothetical protein